MKNKPGDYKVILLIALLLITAIVIGQIITGNATRRRIIDPAPGCTDRDLDGYCTPYDCDDSNPAINPKSTDICNNGIDENCNNKIDDPCPICFSLSSKATTQCSSAVKNDFCDSDTSSPIRGYLQDSVYNGVSCVSCGSFENTCNDLLDNDCDGMVDCADNDCMYIGACTLVQWGFTCRDIVTGVDYGIYETSCTNLLDDDGDGHVDCNDSDCIYGDSCQDLDETSCSCPDLDLDNQIFHDWDDLNLARGTPDYAKVYACTQIYNPFCTDPETKDFILWMKNKSYIGRIINMYAQSANNPEKRSTGPNTNLQFYYNLRIDNPFGNNQLPEQIALFKSDQVYTLEFIELVANDSEIINQLNTASDVENLLQPYFSNQIFNRPFDFVYRQESINYVSAFGPYFNCTIIQDSVCFDGVRVRNWLNNYLLLHKNAVVHWGAKQLTSGKKVYLPLFGLIYGQVYQNHMLAGVSNYVYAHEYGHYLALPHPLSRQETAEKNVNNLLGPCGVMAGTGYVYGCFSRLDPIDSYSLEPYSGYSNLQYGQLYSQDFINSCV